MIIIHGAVPKISSVHTDTIANASLILDILFLSTCTSARGNIRFARKFSSGLVIVKGESVTAFYVHLEALRCPYERVKMDATTMDLTPRLKDMGPAFSPARNVTSFRSIPLHCLVGFIIHPSTDR